MPDAAAPLPATKCLAITLDQKSMPSSPDNSHPFEWKASDWGELDGRLVAVDYAAPVLFPDDD
jgi:hypothetical protein